MPRGIFSIYWEILSTKYHRTLIAAAEVISNKSDYSILFVLRILFILHMFCIIMESHWCSENAALRLVGDGAVAAGGEHEWVKVHRRMKMRRR